MLSGLLTLSLHNSHFMKTLEVFLSWSNHTLKAASKHSSFGLGELCLCGVCCYSFWHKYSASRNHSTYNHMHCDFKDFSLFAKWFSWNKGTECSNWISFNSTFFCAFVAIFVIQMSFTSARDCRSRFGFCKVEQIKLRKLCYQKNLVAISSIRFVHYCTNPPFSFGAENDFRNCTTDVAEENKINAGT